MRIIACGDALFSSHNLVNRIDRRILAEFSKAEAVFANAEFSCPKRTTPPMPRRFVTAVDARALDELSALGVNLISFANNHTGDFGPQGVLDTIEACEERNILPCGIGRSLEEARTARFLDTPKGRVALIAASSTRSAEFTASSPGVGILPRPGLNPLRWERNYVLSDKEFQQLQHIDDLLGTSEARREIMRVEVMPDQGEDRFKFGSIFEGWLQIERGDRAYVRYSIDEQDSTAILESIQDAKNRADYVFFSLHTHEGVNNNWYSPEPASFIEEFSRRAIDAGADAVFGQGAHMLRGIEIYEKKPIFYSLNSLMMEFESGEQKMTPEMYQSYGFSKESLPSRLHRSRIHDRTGKRIGFYGENRFSHGIAAICDFEGGSSGISLIPLDLDLNRARMSERGLPFWAQQETVKEITENLAKMSSSYDTKIVCNEANLLIEVSGGN